MAQKITRLLPNQNIDPKNVVNLFSLNTASGEAGTFVKIVSANLSEDPVKYVNSSYFVNRMGTATSQYPEVPHKVGVAAGTGDGPSVFGMLLSDVRTVDENGEKLNFYSKKREELECLLSGEAVPIVTAGIVDLNVRGLAGGVCPSVGHKAILSTNGQITGVAAASRSAEQIAATVGTIIGTGFRESQQTTDVFAGPWVRLKFSIN